MHIKSAITILSELQNDRIFLKVIDQEHLITVKSIREMPTEDDPVLTIETGGGALRLVDSITVVQHIDVAAITSILVKD